MKAAALVLVVLMAAHPALAAPCEEVAAVTLPCAGLLLPPEEAQRALVCLRADLPACLLDLSAQAEAHGILVESLQREIALERAARLEVEEVAADLAAKFRPPAIWESPILWGLVGLVVGVAAGVAIVVAVDR